jgi:hypothetical protein
LATEVETGVLLETQAEKWAAREAKAAGLAERWEAAVPTAASLAEGWEAMAGRAVVTSVGLED